MLAAYFASQAFDMANLVEPSLHLHTNLNINKCKIYFFTENNLEQSTLLCGRNQFWNSYRKMFSLTQLIYQELKVGKIQMQEKKNKF